MSSDFDEALERARNKPRIDSISQQHCFLTVILCIIAMEIGTYWCYAEVAPSKCPGARLNLIVAGALLMNTLAYQFRWSRRSSICLQIGAWAWLGLVFVALLFWH